MNWDLILDYIKVIIYPIIIAGTILYYRKNFAYFIDRIWKVKFPGGELETEKQLEAQESEDKDIISDKELENLFDDGNLVQNIKDNYEKTIETVTKSNQELLNQIAVKDLMIDFERIYRVIFGSQISLLQHLNMKGMSGESRVYLESFFQTTKNIWPALGEWMLDQYLNFLITKELVDTSQGIYRITEKGRVFLSYITNSGYTDQKNL